MKTSSDGDDKPNKPTTISYVSLLVTSQIVVTITIAKLKDRVTNKE